METGSITVDGNKVGIITASLEGEDPSYPEMPFYESEGYPNSADFDRNVRLGHKHGYYPKSGSGGGNEGYVSSGDDPEFTARVDRMIEAAKKEGITIGRGGGFRTRAQQERLYREKPGLAAPPGHSLHELGIARDLTYGPGGAAWAHKHAAEFGLRFPMSYEPWHVQPVEGRGLLKHRAPSAGTTPPAGSVRGSWFSDTSTASGKSAATTAGIALPSSAGLGKMYEVTGPDGKKMLLPQIDVGPARWTGRGIDFSKPAAQQLGYDPTGHHFTVKPVSESKTEPEAPVSPASGQGYDFSWPEHDAPADWHVRQWKWMRHSKNIEKRPPSKGWTSKQLADIKQQGLVGGYLMQELEKKQLASPTPPSELSKELGWEDWKKATEDVRRAEAEEKGLLPTRGLPDTIEEFRKQYGRDPETDAELEFYSEK